MSVVVEDPPYSIPLVHKTSSASRVLNEKHTIFLGSKTKPIRLDSPTTIQACDELGLLIDDLKQKTIEDFKDPTIEENMVQLRFNHYIKRFNQSVKDVVAVKRRIARKLRNQQLEEQQQIASETRPMLTQSASAVFHPTIPSGFVSPYRKTVGGAKGMANSIHTDFNKTVSYLRTCHGEAEMKDLDEILGENESPPQFYSQTSPVGTFRQTLTEEVSRFNKTKQQKQREAKEIYAEELKRIKMLESLKERQKKQEEKEKKAVLERKKKEDEKKRVLEEKEEKIRELEEKYKEMKDKENEKMKLKFEGARRKFQEEAEEKKRALAERERMMEMKMREIEERRRRLKEEELMNSDLLKEEIESKLQSTKNKQREQLSQKSQRVKSQLSRIEENVARNKEYQTLVTEENVKKLVGKLVKKEESVKIFKDKHHSIQKKKELENADRDRRLVSNQEGLDAHHQDRMKEIDYRFKKVQENLESKREADEKSRKLRGELNRLKLHDKLENHTRLQRRLQHERLKILDKERYEQEKVAWIKSHREIAQKAKLEVAIQSKLEKDRIDEAVNRLGKVVYTSTSSDVMSPNQKKLLKVILSPKDFREIDEVEKKKENAKKVTIGQLEEANNSGLLQIASPVKKRF